MEKSGIILVMLINRLQASDLGLTKIGRESQSTKHALKT
jgi:hypothetical protein